MSQLPYDRPSDPAKRHSAALTDGPDRAAARAMLKGMGFTDEDLAQPIVGVATTWIETMPCNLNQRRLAEFVKAGIREAGGTPMEFNTIAVSDGVAMGTEGMKASLVSREIVADSIELVARGHLFDGLVVLSGCDKTNPGAAMAVARLDIPSVILYNGTIYPGTYKGEAQDVVSVFEAIGAYRAGKISLEELYEIESVACPGAGACGGQFTANTMSMCLEFLGLSPAGPQRHPGRGPAQGRGRPPVRRRWSWTSCDATCDRAASSPAQSLENAIAGVAATGGSTNAVLHLLAIASEFGIPLDIDDFDVVAARTPLIGDLRPGGRYSAADIDDAGGVGIVIRELLKQGLMHGEPTTVTGQSIADIAASVEETPGQQVFRPIEQPIKATGGLAILRGTLAPDGCVIKLAGHERRSFSGPARVFDSEPACFEARQAQQHQAGRRGRAALRRSRGRTGHAGDAQRHGRHRGRGPRRVGGAAHRRPLQRRHARPDDRARGARRPPWADRSPSSSMATPSPSTSTGVPSTWTSSAAGPRRAPGALARAGAALPQRRHGQVRRARQLSQPGRGHQPETLTGGPLRGRAGRSRRQGLAGPERRPGAGAGPAGAPAAAEVCRASALVLGAQRVLAGRVVLPGLRPAARSSGCPSEARRRGHPRGRRPASPRWPRHRSTRCAAGVSSPFLLAVASMTIRAPLTSAEWTSEGLADAARVR